MDIQQGMTRRHFIRLAMAMAAAPLLSHSKQAAAVADFWSRPRTLKLRRLVTGETVTATYWAEGEVIASEYSALCTVLRDVRANESTAMSLDLLNILTGIQGWFRGYGQDRVIDITSGLRLPSTNNRIEGAAKDSLHTKGRAADIRMTDVPPDYIAKLGMYLEGGGVGIYPDKNFTHVDDGRIRSWRG
ncbi:YcbK family protein [Achromobacter ruhlandii]|uniref:YcbK family protein n=1 Tax=Achromobacter ruhlandii TaxID=72557 RepID=UPI003BA1D409